MTDLVGSETEESGAGEPQLDTTNGTRDPLTTDDGVIAASATIPQVQDGQPGDDQDDRDEGVARRDSADTSLDITEDGADPLVDAPEEG